MIDLGFDASPDDISRPLLKGGNMPLKIAATKQVTSTNGHPQLQVTYKTTEEAETVDGKTVKPGFTINQRYLLKPTGGMTEEMIRKNLGSIHFSAVGAGRVNTGEWVGKTIMAQVKLREARHDDKTDRDYPASNEVGFVNPIKK